MEDETNTVPEELKRAIALLKTGYTIARHLCVEQLVPQHVQIVISCELHHISRSIDTIESLFEDESEKKGELGS